MTYARGRHLHVFKLQLPLAMNPVWNGLHAGCSSQGSFQPQLHLSVSFVSCQLQVCHGGIGIFTWYWILKDSPTPFYPFFPGSFQGQAVVLRSQAATPEQVTPWRIYSGLDAWRTECSLIMCWFSPPYSQRARQA